MGRTLTLNDRGELRFRESRANGSNEMRLRAPAAVTADATLTLPDGLPGSPLFLQVAADGTMTYAASGAGLTLQNVYDAGPDIVFDTDPIGMLQANNASVLVIDKTGAGAGRVIDLENDGTGSALYIQQDGGGNAIEVVQNGTGTQSVLITQNAANVHALHIAQTQNADAIRIRKTNALAGSCIDIDNDGTGRSLLINQDGAAGAAVITQNATGACLTLSKAAGNGECLVLTQTQNQPTLDINKSGAGSGNVVDIDNDGTGDAIMITQDGNGVGIEVLKNGTGGGNCVTITNLGTGRGLSITQQTNAPTQEVLHVTSSVNSRLVLFQKTASGAGTLLDLDNDGTGVGILLDMAVDGSAGIAITMAAASIRNAIEITHNGANDPNDIRGTATNWRITKNGDIRGGRFTNGTSNLTIATGAVTIDKHGYLVIDTEAAAASDDLDNILSVSSDPVGAGCVIYLRAANSARTVVVKNGTGNLRLSGADMSLDNADDTIVLIYNGTNWLELCRSNNGA